MKGLAGQRREAEARLAAASRRELARVENALRGLVRGDAGSAASLRQALQRLAGWAAWLPGGGTWAGLLQRECRPWSVRRPERAVATLRAYYARSGLLLHDSREALRQALLTRLRSRAGASADTVACDGVAADLPDSTQACLRVAAALGLLPPAATGDSGAARGWLLVLASGAEAAAAGEGPPAAPPAAGPETGRWLPEASLPAVLGGAESLDAWRRDYRHHCREEALLSGLERLTPGLLGALLDSPSDAQAAGGAARQADAAAVQGLAAKAPSPAGSRPFPWELFSGLQALLRVAGLEAAAEAALDLQVRLGRAVDPVPGSAGAEAQTGWQAPLHELSLLLTRPDAVATMTAGEVPRPCLSDPELAAALRQDVAGLLKSLDEAGRREEALRWHPSQPLLTALYRCRLAAAELGWQDLQLPLALARVLLLACRQERRELAPPLWRALRALALRVADRAGPCRQGQRRALLLIEIALRREWMALQQRRAGLALVLEGASPRCVPLQQLPRVLAGSLRLLGVPPLPALQSAAGLAALRESLLAELRLLEQGAAGLGVHRLEALAAALLELHEELKAQPLPHPGGLLAQAHRHLATLLHQAAAWQEVERAHDTVCALYTWLEERPGGPAPMPGRDIEAALGEEVERLLQTIRRARVSGPDGEDLGPSTLQALERMQGLSRGAGAVLSCPAECQSPQQNSLPVQLPFGSLRQSLRRFLARLGSALEFSLHLELRDADLLCSRHSLEQARPILETLLRQLFLESLQSGPPRQTPGPRMRRIVLRAAQLPGGLQITLTEPASASRSPPSIKLKTLRRRLRPAQLRLEQHSDARHYHLLISPLPA